MSRREKLITRLLRKPKDFSYDELVSLLSYFGYKELRKGKASGSRHAFVHNEINHIFRLHKPHPKNILKRYQIDEIIDGLTKIELL